MATIAVVSLKGGSAKTTSTVYLAVAAQRSGLNVAVADLDPQSSAAAWIDAVTDLDVPVYQPTGRRIRSEIENIAGRYDHLFVDTAPGEGEMTVVSAAVAAADLVVVPVAPSGLNVHRIMRTLDLAAALDVPAAVLVVMTDLRWKTHTELVEALDGDPTITRFDTFIRRTVRITGALDRPIGGDLHGYDAAWLELEEALKEMG